MPRKKCKTPIAPLDIWTMLLCTVRYSMGRRTYMSLTAPNLVLDYHEYLTDDQLIQIANEIETEIVVHYTHPQQGYLGDPCDVTSWENAVGTIRGKILARNGIETDWGKWKYRVMYTNTSETSPAVVLLEEYNEKGLEKIRNDILEGLEFSMRSEMSGFFNNRTHIWEEFLKDLPLPSLPQKRQEPD